MIPTSLPFNTASAIAICILLQFDQLRLVLGQCGTGDSKPTFAKYAGFFPALPSAPPLLYAASYGTAITAECYNRCRSSDDCKGFIVDYSKTSCFRIPSGYIKENLIYNPSVSYFKKICLPVPANCTDRAWIIDVVPGYELVGAQHTVIPNIDDKMSCAVQCLRQSNSGMPCLSANFYGWSRTCTLSTKDRWSAPDSFVISSQRNTDYIENQCIKSDGPTCWHDPYLGKSSLRSDLQLLNVSQADCANRCINSLYFQCRAYSYVKATTISPPHCFLHSDSSLTSAGPDLTTQLTPTQGAIYVQAISCINMTVTCSKSSLVVTLYSPKFVGRLFVEGHSTDCGVQGRGSNSTVLDIPVMNVSADPSTNKCGVQQALALGRGYNRTMMSTVVVVQYHQLIQTVNDRVVRVTCLLTESSVPIPSPGPQNNATLAATVTVQEPGVQSEITGTGGPHIPEINGTVPRATMRVVDPRTGSEASNIAVGDPLTLIITVDPPFNVSYVRAGHLVASSGSQDTSLLLLDSLGCPPDPKLFPALTPVNRSVGDINSLSATFKAFKFSSSPVLMLSVVMTFCAQPCQPTDCGNGVISYGKRRRRAASDYFEEVPLVIAIVVQPSQVENGTFWNETMTEPPEALEGEPIDGVVCVSFLAAALVALFWLLLQCILLTIFCCFLHRKQKEHEDAISLRQDFQPPKHVSWVDDQDVPSRRFRLSTPVET